MVTDWVAVVSTGMLPKEIVPGDTAICGGVVPEPVRDTTVGEFVALLRKEADPLMLPLVCGAKRMLTCWLCPAGIVTGKVGAVTLKPDPLAVAEEIVTAELPVAVMTTFLVALLPTTTLPNDRLFGETPRVKVDGVVAVPDSATGPILFAASLLITRLPV